MTYGNYAICFDFPDVDEPMYAAFVGDALGWTTNLANAKTFHSEQMADLFLKNSYGGSAKWGVVVEIGE